MRHPLSTPAASGGEQLSAVRPFAVDDVDRLVVGDAPSAVAARAQGGEAITEAGEARVDLAAREAFAELVLAGQAREALRGGKLHRRGG